MISRIDRDLARKVRRRLARIADDKAYARVVTREHLKQQLLMTNAPPRLLDLQQASAATHESAMDLIRALLPDHSSDELQLYQDEHRRVASDVDRRANEVQRLYPEFFTVEEQMSELLYVATRALRPTVMLETGVADGRSTAMTLAALEANGHGHLHSIEISMEVGGLVTDRDRWVLHVIDPESRDLENVVGDLGPIDVFLHDGDHSYANQTREYELVWPRMVPGGLFLSDDIDWSWAFLHFLDRRGLKPHTLMERRKATGAVVR